MRVAVACKEIEIARRFDLTDNFMLYNVVNGIITGCQSLPLSGRDCKNLVEIFSGLDVATLICNLIAVDDATQFCAADIEVVAGVSCEPREAVQGYLTKTLIGADSMCHIED